MNRTMNTTTYLELARIIVPSRKRSVMTASEECLRAQADDERLVSQSIGTLGYLSSENNAGRRILFLSGEAIPL